MESFWPVIATLPVMIVTALFAGYEPPFYFGIGLLGFAFWSLAESRSLKIPGIIIFFIGIGLYVSSLAYNFSNGNIFPKDPFEFKFFAALSTIGIPKALIR